MPSIVIYQKAYDATTTYQAALPEGATELCTLDGVTYVSLPDGASLPDGQPAQIAASIQVVILDATLRVAIKGASPHCALIKSRGHQRVIDAGYSREDQAKLDRKLAAAGAGLITLTPADMSLLTAYAGANLAADAWASEQYAGLGL